MHDAPKSTNDSDGGNPNATDASGSKSLEFARQQVASLTAKRDAAAQTSHGGDYKSAQDELTWWKAHLAELEAAGDADAGEGEESDMSEMMKSARQFM